MNLSDLPDELQPKRPAMSETERAERLVALGALIATKRDEAVKARKESGVEEVWMAAEDAYLGIDDTNRHEFSKAKWAKSTTMQGPLTSNTPPNGNKSTAFVPLTSQYVDMGAGKISEIVLPIDDKAFSFDASPVAELVGQQEDLSPLVVNGQQAFKPADPGQEQHPAAPPGMVPATVKDAADIKQEKATAAAKKAETRIYDWMVESRYPKQMRRVIHDSARIGTGVLKGPFPERRTNKAFSVKAGKGVLEIVSSISPAAKRISAWNLFPHGSCGEDIQEGDYILERDYLSPGSVKKLKGLTDQIGKPIYIASQIDQVLTEGPDKCNLEAGRNPNEPEKKNRFTVWYFTGTLNREDMELLEAPGADELPDEVVECYCILTLINDTVVRATFNPLEKTGNFPYRVYPWRIREGHWAGVGVAEQVSLPQRMVNAGTRGWMNNAGKSAGSQIIMDQRAVVPADGSPEITPDKLWYLTGEAVTDDVRKVFMAIELPDRGTTLQAIIQYAFKLAEQASNIPLVAQGQTGSQDPETFGQAELNNSNANTLLREQALSLDDHITEPLVQDFYEWLLLDPEIPDSEKGDFNINARGSLAMVEKAIQEKTMVQMLPLIINPVWGQDPKKFMGEVMKSKRMNPTVTAYSDADLAKLQNATPPPTPQEKVATINANAKLQGIQLQNQGELQQVAAEAQNEQNMLLNGGTTPHTAMAMARVEQERIRATTAKTVEASRAYAEEARANKEMQIAQQNGEFELQKLQLQKDLAVLQYAHDNQMKLADVKSEMAQTAMNNQTKKELAAAEIQLAQSEGAQDRQHDMTKHVTSLQRDEISTDHTP